MGAGRRRSRAAGWLRIETRGSACRAVTACDPIGRRSDWARDPRRRTQPPDGHLAALRRLPDSFALAQIMFLFCFAWNRRRANLASRPQAPSIPRFSGGRRVGARGTTGPDRWTSVLSSPFPSWELLPSWEQSVPGWGTSRSQGGIKPFPSRDQSDRIGGGGEAAKPSASTIAAPWRAAGRIRPRPSGSVSIIPKPAVRRAALPDLKQP